MVSPWFCFSISYSYKLDLGSGPAELATILLAFSGSTTDSAAMEGCREFQGSLLRKPF
jgi:hypothetical protein